MNVKARPSVPPLVRYFRRCVEHLPKINTKGELAWKPPEVTGPAAVKALLDPKNVLSKADQQKVKRERCPNFPVVNTPNPDMLAKSHLSKNQANITPEIRAQAADFFRIPEKTRALLVAPEFFCREELLKHPKFQVKDAEGKVTGVSLCCPHCESNIGVSTHKRECKNVASMPRSMINMDATRMPLLGVRYQCSNKECTGPVPAGDVDPETDDITEHKPDGTIRTNKQGSPVIWRQKHHLETGHTFPPWTKQCFLQFPKKVRKLFSRHVFGLAAEGEPKNDKPIEQCLRCRSTTKRSLKHILDDLKLG